MKTKQKKSGQLHISISPEALEIVDSKARAAAMSRSEYIRQTALGYSIKVPPVPTEFLNSICTISNLLTNNKSLDIITTQMLRKEVDNIWQSLNS